MNLRIARPGWVPFHERRACPRSLWVVFEPFPPDCDSTPPHRRERMRLARAVCGPLLECEAGLQTAILWRVFSILAAISWAWPTSVHQIIWQLLDMLYLSIFSKLSFHRVQLYICPIDWQHAQMPNPSPDFTLPMLCHLTFVQAQV